MNRLFFLSLMCFVLNGTFTIGFASDAPQFACRTKVSTIEKYGNIIKNAGCAILKYDRKNNPTHILMYHADINNDGKVDGLSLPGGKRADIKYDRDSKSNDDAAEGDPNFAAIADHQKIEYTESCIQTACRETREETLGKMPAGSHGLDVIVVDLINPEDKKFFVFTCLAPDIDKLKVSGGFENGDFRWVSKADIDSQKFNFNYANRDIAIKALEPK